MPRRSRTTSEPALPENGKSLSNDEDPYSGIILGSQIAKTTSCKFRRRAQTIDSRHSLLRVTLSLRLM